MANQKDSATRRRKSEETRRRIMLAGREVFTRKGYHDTRVSEIIDRAGLGHGTFWLYFRDKEDLLRSLVEEMLQDFVTENLADRLTPERIDPTDLEDIEEVISRAVKVFEDNQPLHQAIVEAAMQSEEFAAIYDQINLELAEVYRRYLSFLLPDPAGLQVDLSQVALLLVVTIAYNSLMWANGFMHCSREDFVRSLSTLLYRFINFPADPAGMGKAGKARKASGARG
jgi:AcrR family transcriptional regulator